MNIYIYGVPGSGKTTIADAVSRKLVREYLELDIVREMAQKEKNPQDSPFLFETTLTAWRHFGTIVTAETARMGLLEVRKSLQPYVEEVIGQKSLPFVAESAFLDPIHCQRNGLTFLIVPSDPNQHKRQFFTHREDNENNGIQFKCSQYINHYLQSEAQSLGIKIIVNKGAIQSVVDQIVQNSD